MNPEPTADRVPHGGNGGEELVFTPTQAFKVDGYDAGTNKTKPTVYEFHRCLWHGCPRCFPNHQQFSKFHLDRTFREVYEGTCAKEKLLRQQGYHVIVKWECDWDREVKTNQNLQQFLTTLEIINPLKPRDPFFRGRTNAATLFYEANESAGEQIKYVDVTLLYPWVNKNGEYPEGHPDIMTHPVDQDIRHYFGIKSISCHLPALSSRLTIPLP